MSTAEYERVLGDTEFAKLRKIIHEKTGITIAENRKHMLFSRLQRRLRQSGEQTFSGYIDRVLADAVEAQEMINRVTTNETYFFRTPRVWAYLEGKVLPECMESGRRRNLKVWSAASSTGEEAHTLGVFLEDFRRSNPGFDYSITATDISSRVIEVATDGVYNGRSIARFKREKPKLFEQYMTGDDEAGYRVLSDIKRKISFGLKNLLSAPSHKSYFDVVFLRNVLIYFSDSDQEKILKNVSESMVLNGTLFIGESETLSNLSCPFEQVAPMVYRNSKKSKALLS